MYRYSYINEYTYKSVKLCFNIHKLECPPSIAGFWKECLVCTSTLMCLPVSILWYCGVLHFESPREIYKLFTEHTRGTNTCYLKRLQSAQFYGKGTLDNLIAVSNSNQHFISQFYGEIRFVCVFYALCNSSLESESNIWFGTIWTENYICIQRNA